MIDFPNAPTAGQIFNSGVGPIYQWDGTAWNLTPFTLLTARARNRIINPTMQVSQENGTTNMTVNNAYPADQWVMQFNIAASNGQKSTMPVPTPEGTTSALAIYTGIAKPTLAAGDYFICATPIEAINVSDLQWGTANAKPIVLRFCAYSEVAGTYGLSISNNAGDRSYCASFTIPSSVPTVVTLAIPGDTIGTWLNAAGLGVRVRFCYACGSSLVGVAGWNAGPFFAPPGCVNGAATVSKPLYITDVGLYSDPQSTGLAPPFEVPSYEDDLQHCMRYWQLRESGLIGYFDKAGTVQYNHVLMVSMRTTPTMAKISDGTNSNLSAVNHVPVGPRSLVDQYTVAGIGAFSHLNGTYYLTARLI